MSHADCEQISRRINGVIWNYVNLSKTVEELRQDSQFIQANSKKKLRDNKKLL